MKGKMEGKGMGMGGKWGGKRGMKWMGKKIMGREVFVVDELGNWIKRR